MAMQSDSVIRVGLITVMSEDSTWAESFIRKFQDNHVQAKAALSGLGFDVRTAEGDHLGRTHRQMVAMANELRSRGIDVLVLYVPDWSYSSNAVAGGVNADVPVIVWSDAHKDQNGIVGASIIRGALEAVGIKAKLVHGLPEDPLIMARIGTLCRGVASATKLRNQKFGIGGGRSMGMYTAHVDPSKLRKTFGVEIDYWEQVELLRRSQEYPAAEVAEMIGWMKNKFGRIEAKADVLDAQVRMYLALRDLAREKEYDAVCVKCLPELPGLPHHLLPGHLAPQRPLRPQGGQGVHRLRVRGGHQRHPDHAADENAERRTGHVYRRVEAVLRQERDRYGKLRLIGH